MNNQKKRKKNSNKFLRTLNILIVLSFVVVVLFTSRMAVFHTIGDTNLQEFVKTRKRQEEVLLAKRGAIKDVHGNTLAQTLSTYNLYAVLDPKYSDNLGENDRKRHVTNPEAVARGLAPIIGMDEGELLERLKMERFQVEFHPNGNGLKQSQKDAIDALELEGLYFNENASRSYPQARFASHIIGYASYNAETEHLEGMMGIEAKLDEDYLSGKDGIHEYSINMNGVKIDAAPEIKVDAVNGDDVYLTIDTPIQLMTENKMKEIETDYEVDWASVIVANPKTGAILAAAQTPSFDPNNYNDIKSYINTIAQAEFEVGSIMKPITFASAMDVGRYNGDELVATGAVEIDGSRISDWNGYGFGTVAKDKGICYSANTITANVVQNNLTPEEHKEYMKRFGFGQKTNIEITDESTGTLQMSNEIERVTTGFGQGTTATVAQVLQAYNAIANDGKMMQLHLVDRIVNPETGIYKYKAEPKVVREPISKESADHITELMVETANDPGCASSDMYKMSTGTFAGKTGTAEVVNPDTGKYYSGMYTYTYAGFAPAEDPQFVILSTVFLPRPNNNTATVKIITGLHDEINRYLAKGGNKIPTTPEGTPSILHQIESFPSFINARREDVIAYAESIGAHNLVIIGAGDYIINQNIEPYTNYLTSQKLILQTDGAEIQYPNFTGWSRKDVESYAKMTGIEVFFEGTGYVGSQSIPEGTVINGENRSITIQLVV